jgi:hypothetical protein
LAGAAHETWRDALVVVTTGVPGALGTAAGVAATTSEGAPPPAALTAEIRNEYVVPFTRPVTVVVRVAGFAIVAIVVQVAPSVD